MSSQALDDLLNTIDDALADLVDALPEMSEGVVAQEIGLNRILEDPEDETEGALQQLLADHVLFTPVSEGGKPPIRRAVETLGGEDYPAMDVVQAIFTAPWDLVRLSPAPDGRTVCHSLTGGPMVVVDFPRAEDLDTGDEALVRIIRARGLTVALELCPTASTREMLPSDIMEELDWTAAERDLALRPLRLFLATMVRGLANLGEDADDAEVAEHLDAEMESLLEPMATPTPGLRIAPPPPVQMTPASSGIARNASCPCGSGKKFKKCCGA